MRFDPELAEVVATLPKREVDDISDEAFAAARAAANARYGERRPAPDGMEETDHEVAGTGQPVRVYRTSGLVTPAPALVWVHGGGFTVGSIDADDFRCRRYARDAECVVVSVEYGLAPEHPYPEGIDDCWAALRWTLERAGQLGIDLARVAVGGASAGGCMAAVLAQRARDRGAPALCFQLLVYPMLDDRLETLSMREKVDVPIFGRPGAMQAWRRYLRGVTGPVTADAAPARALDLAALPPAYVLTAEHDPLRDEGNDYAMRLQRAGVPVELHQFPGTFHGFEAIGIRAGVVRRALDEQALALRAALHAPSVAVP